MTAPRRFGAAAGSWARSALQRLPSQPMLARPSLDHRDLVAEGQPVGAAAALHDRAVAPHLDRHALVQLADGIFAGERPYRSLAADAQMLVGGNAVTHALAFAEEVVPGLDLAEAPDRLLVVAAGLISDIR